MPLNNIRNQYTEHMRRAIKISGMRREDMPPVVRYINELMPYSVINYSQINDNIVEDTIEREILYFELIGHNFEWKVFDYDEPEDLRDQLAQHGFEIGEEEAVLVLDCENLPERLQQDFAHDVREVTDADEVANILEAVQKSVFNGDAEDDWISENVTALLRDTPDSIQFFAAYADDKPVSAAWIVYAEDGNPFAGLYGGATLEAYRGKGYYSALLAARAKAAIGRGIRYLTVDASPMSRPILEKLGFQHIASAWECNYRLQS